MKYLQVTLLLVCLIVSANAVTGPDRPPRDRLIEDSSQAHAQSTADVSSDEPTQPLLGHPDQMAPLGSAHSGFQCHSTPTATNPRPQSSSRTPRAPPLHVPVHQSAPSLTHMTRSASQPPIHSAPVVDPPTRPVSVQTLPPPPNDDSIRVPMLEHDRRLEPEPSPYHAEYHPQYTVQHHPQHPAQHPGMGFLGQHLPQYPAHDHGQHLNHQDSITLPQSVGQQPPHLHPVNLPPQQQQPHHQYFYHPQHARHSITIPQQPGQQQPPHRYTSLPQQARPPVGVMRSYMTRRVVTRRVAQAPFDVHQVVRSVISAGLSSGLLVPGECTICMCDLDDPDKKSPNAMRSLLSYRMY